MSGEEARLDDPRWTAFNAGELACSCGERHVGLFPVHIRAPLGWAGPPEWEPDEALRRDGNFLSANYCVLGGRYFALRMRLPLQIRGAAPHAFMFTVWASVARSDFEGYLASRDGGKLHNWSRAQARLVNRIADYPDTADLLGTAFQQEDGGVPLLIVHATPKGQPSSHPLTQDQRNGIGVDKMLALFAAYNHDMRPAAAGFAR